MKTINRYPSLTNGRINRSSYLPMNWQYEKAMADVATRECQTLAAAAGQEARERGDALLMGGEL